MAGGHFGTETRQERVSDDLEHIDFHSNRVISGQLESLCDPLAFCFKCLGAMCFAQPASAPRQLQHLDFHQNYEKITGDLEFLRDLTCLGSRISFLAWWHRA